MSGHTYSTGNTTGSQYKALCEKCKIEQRHVVEASARSRWDSDDWSGITEYEVIRCLNCDSLSFRRESSDSEGYFYDHENEEYISDVSVDLYPNRTAGRFKIEEHWQLPPEVRAIYDELITAMNSEQPILAGLAFRILIEMICKEQAAIGKNLFAKIDDLKTKGVLTNAGADILHKLRSMGNDSAHEAKPSTSKQLILAMDVVENLLQSVYIHPAQAKAAFK
ncbi:MULTISPECIES: DUF4145 domain-containing protein [Pseudomonas]|uniref:DUF4145 domain-containing protein n=1 Tax=Pseudomonas TaxID=286 RepID=UPI002457B95A|nr:DUF4145 domain-containing protein [Pseudomonas sp. BN607]MDH4550870.1 DUF4145 domain-containing protein [Pseudomonas sp. BN607]